MSKETIIKNPEEIFKYYGGSLPTGAGGLTRGMLRRLERYGKVESRLARMDNGMLVKVWTWIGEL